MPGAFPELVGRLAEAMGQRLEGLREDSDGILLRTPDGFLFAFLEDPTQVSLGQVQRLAAEVDSDASRLVVLTPGRFPLALTGEVLRRRGTVVEGARFHELVHGLGLGEYLGDEPRPTAPGRANRLLPSAQQLDAIMQRGRTWSEWGVPALALRFFRQAAGLKPGFAPARVGVGQALLGLGLVTDARRSFEEALGLQPDSLDARLGLAAVLGAEGHVTKEVEAYRALPQDGEAGVIVQAHLIAALVAQGNWSEARGEIEDALRVRPEDPQMRFLLSAAYEKEGHAALAQRERSRARTLGLDPARERTLCLHLGLPVPEALPAAGPVPPKPASTDTRAPADRRRPKRPKAGAKPRAKVPPPVRGRKRK